MGKFVAYDRANDAKVNKIDTSTNKAYYKTLVADALGDYFVPHEGDNNDSLIGYIKLGTERIRDAEAAKRLIAEEEGKYYYKWEHEDKEVKNSENKHVLNNFDRVDVQRYHTSLLDKSVKKEISNQDTYIKNTGLTVLPFKLEPGPGSNLSFHADNSGVALYLDANPDTQNYKYRKEENNLLYTAVKTWTPKTIDEAPQSEEQFEYYKTSHGEGGKLRYLYYLWKECTGLGFNRKSTFTFKSGIEHAETYLKRHLKTSYGGDEKEGEKKDEKTAEEFAAEDQAKMLPNNYRCFYYSIGEELDSFLTDVSISVEGRRSSGYEGRADRVMEVEYRWQIVPKEGEDDFYLAKLLSYIIGLSRDWFVPEGKPIPNDFRETNFPKNDNPPCLFKYFKQFKSNVERRNNPRVPNKPRTDLRRKKDENMGFRKWKKGDALDGVPWSIGDKSTRENAGSELAKALKPFSFYSHAMNKYPDITKSKLPATSFAMYVVAEDTTAMTAWKEDNTKTTDKEDNTEGNNSVTTDQEWCHLYGHGDGGSETLDNFISGSKHCNTEQLAIETGQRRVSQNMNIPEKTRKLLTWRITADQIPNMGTRVSKFDTKTYDKLRQCVTSQVDAEIMGWFFTDQKELKVGKVGEKGKELEDLRAGLSKLATKIRDVKQACRDKKGAEQTSEKKRLKELIAFQKLFLERCFLYYPLGRRVHYRIYLEDKKCFEHHFDAQSQSFDVNEAKILDYTVERALYLALSEKGIKITVKRGEKGKEQNEDIDALGYYNNSILDRIKDRFLSKTEVGIVKKISAELDEIEVLYKGKNVDEEARERFNAKLQDIQKDFAEILKKLPEEKSNPCKIIVGQVQTIAEESKPEMDIEVIAQSNKSLKKQLSIAHNTEEYSKRRKIDHT